MVMKTLWSDVEVAATLVQKDMTLKKRSAKFNSPPPPAKHYVSIIIISIIIVGMLACVG